MIKTSWSHHVRNKDWYCHQAEKVNVIEIGAFSLCEVFFSFSFLKLPSNMELSLKSWGSVGERPMQLTDPEYNNEHRCYCLETPNHGKAIKLISMCKGTYSNCFVKNSCA